MGEEALAFVVVVRESELLGALSWLDGQDELPPPLIGFHAAIRIALGSKWVREALAEAREIVDGQKDDA